MTAATVVGLVAGSALIVTAIYVFVATRQFSVSGIGVIIVGMILIGMSQWTTIKVKGGGVDIDLTTLQDQLARTANAVDAVAEEAVATAGVANETRQQLLTISTQLEQRRVLSAPYARALRDSLASAPEIDTTAVNAARASIRAIIRD